MKDLSFTEEIIQVTKTPTEVLRSNKNRVTEKSCIENISLGKVYIGFPNSSDPIILSCGFIFPIPDRYIGPVIAFSTANVNATLKVTEVSYEIDQGNKDDWISWPGISDGSVSLEETKKIEKAVDEAFEKRDW